MRLLKISSIGFLLLFIFFACDKKEENAEQLVLKGKCKLALDVNPAETQNYDQAWNMALGVGIEEIKLSFDWNQLEKSTGFDMTYIDIANIYYPASNIPVTIILRPINTNMLTLPQNLATLSFDNPQVINRFKILLDTIHAHLPNLSVNAICIGNEISAYLQTDAAKWQQFTSFFTQTKAHVKLLWGNNMNVSTVSMFYGLLDNTTKSFYHTINNEADFLAVTYYPLNNDFTVKNISEIQPEITNLVNEYPTKDIYFEECGYPSGLLCNSSEDKQADFVSEIFKAWENHYQKIKLFDFTFMTDANPTQVDQWLIDYGMSGQTNADKFREYLATLGLRTYTGNGLDKKGFIRLKDEAQKRGW